MRTPKTDPTKAAILTALCTIMVFIPWTIFPLRTQPWALEIPAAGMIIACYAIFMIFSGIFTLMLLKIPGTEHADEDLRGHQSHLRHFWRGSSGDDGCDSGVTAS